MTHLRAVVGWMRKIAYSAFNTHSIIFCNVSKNLTVLTSCILNEVRALVLFWASEVLWQEYSLRHDLDTKCTVFCRQYSAFNLFLSFFLYPPSSKFCFGLLNVNSISWPLLVSANNLSICLITRECFVSRVTEYVAVVFVPRVDAFQSSRTSAASCPLAISKCRLLWLLQEAYVSLFKERSSKKPLLTSGRFFTMLVSAFVIMTFCCCFFELCVDETLCCVAPRHLDCYSWPLHISCSCSCFYQFPETSLFVPHWSHGFLNTSLHLAFTAFISFSVDGISFTFDWLLFVLSLAFLPVCSICSMVCSICIFNLWMPAPKSDLSIT